MVLVVGGGGGGAGSHLGYAQSGSGGAGGVVTHSAYGVSIGSYSVVVGQGGDGGSPNANGGEGGSSVFGILTASGGGHGGMSMGGTGGSGGGGPSGGGSGASGQGYSGGSGEQAAGGGAGGAATGSTPGNGMTWHGVTNAGGGGGSTNDFGRGRWGGAAYGALGNGENGRGGGGGAGYSWDVPNEYAGGRGGDGAVVVRYPTGTISATGGTITVDGGDTVHTFNTSGTLAVSAVSSPPGRWRLTGTQCTWDPLGTGPAQCDPNAGRWKLTATGGCVWDPWGVGAAECEPAGETPSGNHSVVVLVVGGGGGGAGSQLGYAQSGSGGAGGVATHNAYVASIGTYNVVVGQGGSGGLPNANGSDGGPSVFGTLTASGGGHGGVSTGGAGGSGGGGPSGGGSGTSGQGYSGGTGEQAAGGGAGSAASGYTPGDGITWYGVGYAGGGGGANNDYGRGRWGGVALGALGSGEDGKGGGGGAGFAQDPPNEYAGGRGGDGVVIVRYPTATISATGGSVTVEGGDTVHSFSTSGTFAVSAVTPPLGRWTLTGTQCAWDPLGTGPAQCSPDSGRWKLTATGGCVWDPGDVGPAQCEAGVATPPASATLYDDVAYGGASLSSSTDMSFVGDDWDDRASSISVPPGMTVTVYQHAAYEGESLAVTGDNADLGSFAGPGADGTWNNAVSSILVTPAPPTQPPTRTVILVNGSFNANPDWVQAENPEFQAIASFYGIQPRRHRWQQNSLPEVTFPHYSGIKEGAEYLADFIAELPPGEIDLITHSHGGNVALRATTYLTHRQVDRLINLGTPVNWDLRGHAAPRVGLLCTASSWRDRVQFAGASPFQTANFAMAKAMEIYYYVQAFDAFRSAGDQDNESAWYYLDLAGFEASIANWWWNSTKEEWWGITVPFSNKTHRDMHTPSVWDALDDKCKRR